MKTKSFTNGKRVASLMLAVLVLMSMFPTTVFGAIAKGDAIKTCWVTNAYTSYGDSGVSLHFVDVDGNGTIDTDEICYCIDKTAAVGTSVTSPVKGSGKIEDSDYWKSLSIPVQNGIRRAFIHGYPNNKSDYGVSGIKSVEKIYAVQILAWEYQTGVRMLDDTQTTVIKKTNGKDFSDAFTSNSINNKISENLNPYGFSQDGNVSGKPYSFNRAYSYYKKLVSAVYHHVDTPSFHNTTKTITSLGEHTYTDSNGVLSDFKVKSDNTSIATASISGNKLTVDVKQGAKTTISFTKKNTDVDTAVMFNSGSGKQTMVYGVIEDPVPAKLTIDASSLKGGWTLKKVDENGNGVQNIVFGVYTDNTSVKSQRLNSGKWSARMTNSSGVASSSTTNWVAGVKQYFREIGYVKDGTLYLLEEALPSSQCSGETYTGPELQGVTYTDVEVIESSNMNGGWVYGKVGGVEKRLRVNSTVGSVTIPSDETRATVKFSSDTELTNKTAKGGITVMKTDASGNPLSGVKFGVYSDSGCTNLIKTITTNSTGKASYGGTTPKNFSLEPGVTYYLKEISTVSGYTLDTSRLTATTIADRLVCADNTSGSTTNIQYVDVRLSIVDCQCRLQKIKV